MKIYQSPLTDRYSSQEMLELFSPHFKHSTWRKLWVALAETEKELGLPISDEQIEELKKNVENINFESAAEYEKEFQHDVMAHIHAYGDQCPKARSIIHLGATSCYVTDNTEMIQIKEGIKILKSKLEKVITQLKKFAQEYANQPCLSFTHYQPAQLSTLGKRACIWMQDFLLDFKEFEHREKSLKFLGVKGTTGTQASFLSLFENDHEKVVQLDKLLAEKVGFTQIFNVTGQTYTRKQDAFVLNTLAGIGISAHKFATDIRLLANLKEVEEPFKKNQIGSSAMPYKRNPMLSERICSLSRFLISLTENSSYTAAVQWFERTLDDSANRRLSISEAFLTCDAVLNLMIKVTSGLVVYPKIIEKRIQQELPFMATENILMVSVKKGGDRQELHEQMRKHSIEAAKVVKEEGKENDLLDRIINDPKFKLSNEELRSILDIKKFIGRSPEQVKEFINLEVFNF